MLLGTVGAEEKVLFDFEDASEAKVWSTLEIKDAKEKEPPATVAISDQHATSGKQSLKIIFAGGSWPTITTTNVFEAWTPFQSFKADVTVSRPCLVGFQAMQERSSREHTWEGNISRWVKTALLHPGKNEISAPLHHPNDYAISAQYGKVTRFEIFMYHPHAGEAIYVDNIRLSTQKDEAPPTKTAFRVVGTDMIVSGVRELEEKLRPQWKKPETKTLEQVEAEFKAAFDELKKSHPRAVMATLRDGENGYDGWKDSYFSSHGPDGATLERAENCGKHETQEIFMRHRCPVMQVDLSGIPTGSEILSAKLVIVRGNTDYDKERNPETKPTMWVVEPCNRPWNENEVNAYEYAKDKFWKAVGGMTWDGNDSDFLPLFLAHGPGTGKINVLDFMEAVKFWTDGKHANHGFMLHCDFHDWIGSAYYREAKELRNRPAVFVVYEPKAGGTLPAK